MNYEIIYQKNDILKAIEFSKNKQGMIWQNQGDAGRLLRYFDNIEIRPKDGVVLVSLPTTEGINNLTPIYIRLHHRKAIFKTEVFKSQEGVLILALPSEVTVEKLRKFKRHQIVDIHKRPLIIKNNDLELSIPVVLDEVSQSGMGVFVSEQGIYKLHEYKDKLFVDRLGQLSLEKELLVDLVYSGQIHEGGKTIFKVGMKFEDVLSKDLVHGFVFDETRKSIDDYQYLNFGKIFKTKLKNKITDDQDLILEKKTFSDVFNLWDQKKLRPEDSQYVSYYVHSVSILSCAFAKLADIIDLNSYLQLVYCSYIDALPFFKCGQLLQYRRKEDFIKNQIHFTEAEKQLFFESKEFSYRYAVRDVFAPVEADKLLSNLGKLFGHNKPLKFLSIKKNDLVFFSLFLAQEFFFYVEKNRNWSFEDFGKFIFSKYPKEICPEFVSTLDSVKKSA